MSKYSSDELKMFEKQDHLLLDMELKRAKQSGKSQFKVNVQAFDEVPNFKQHIIQKNMMNLYFISLD